MQINQANTNNNYSGDLSMPKGGLVPKSKVCSGDSPLRSKKREQKIQKMLNKILKEVYNHGYNLAVKTCENLININTKREDDYKN